MMTNELLEAKYRAQRRLDEQAGGDLSAYARNVRQVVQAAEKKHGLKFCYEPVKKKGMQADCENVIIVVANERTL